jgi:hypothetical protein
MDKRATQIAVPEGQFDNGSGTLATIGNRNFGNYWFYLGPAGNIVMVYGRENINTLAAVLSANPPADLPLRLSRCTAYRKSCCYVSIRSCLYRSSTVCF